MHPNWRKILVTPNLPAQLSVVKELAYNLLWVWHYEIRDLFRRMDPDLWRVSGLNPVRLLDGISQRRLDELVEDSAFMAHLERACEVRDDYLNQRPWFAKTYPDEPDFRIAYFSMEFGLTACIPNYSGGLGMLAGDHLKSASDLGVPLVGVGLLYQEGYFRQYLNTDGWQQERYPKNDFYNMPIELMRQAGGAPKTLRLDFPGRQVVFQIWRVQVGRIPLYLLDANLTENSPEDRHITHKLYGGGSETRIQQEIALGIGGMRALELMGEQPQVFHLNEGHAAFVCLEKIRRVKEQFGLDIEEALVIAGQAALFTTHTPVPAGFDRFDESLLTRYIKPYVDRIGLDWERFRAVGRFGDPGAGGHFSMASLALHQSLKRNAVSELHGVVARKMFQSAWNPFPVEEVPVDSVTNGIHAPTWIGAEMAQMFDRYLGPQWRECCDDPQIWRRIEHIPTEEIWRAKERAKERLVAFARRTLGEQLTRQGAAARQLDEAREVLDSRLLTIGFARRFATYKRATLLLSNPERLRALLTDEERPIQILIAGKAHPHDNAGKELIRQLVHVSNQPWARRRMVFLEDYDMEMARMLVQGVDVWLNTPRRPLEACGTSGMKVVPNGGLNASILDGWWDEAYFPGVGWAIGSGEEYADEAYQDQVESQTLYNLLEKEIVPLYYDKGEGSMPREWVKLMKESMMRLAPFFNSHRMVKQYANNYYIPAGRHFRKLTENNAARGRALAAWQRKIQGHWQGVRVDRLRMEAGEIVASGAQLPVRVEAHLGALSPEDVTVQIYYGELDPNHELTESQLTTLEWKEALGEGRHAFEGEVAFVASGLFGYAVRILPAHPDKLHPEDLLKLHWG